MKLGGALATKYGCASIEFALHFFFRKSPITTYLTTYLC